MNVRNFLIFCISVLGFGSQVFSAATLNQSLAAGNQSLETGDQYTEEIQAGINRLANAVNNPIDTLFQELNAGRAIPNTDAEFRQNILRYITLLTNNMEDNYYIEPRDPAAPYDRTLKPCFTEQQREVAFRDIAACADKIRTHVSQIRELFVRALALRTNATMAHVDLANHLTRAATASEKYRAYITDLQNILNGRNLFGGGRFDNPGLASRATRMCEQFAALYELDNRSANLANMRNLTQAPHEASLFVRDHYKTLAQFAQEIEYFIERITPDIEKLEADFAQFSKQVSVLAISNDRLASQLLTEEIDEILQNQALTTNNATRLKAIKADLANPNHKPAEALRLDMADILNENTKHMEFMPPAKDMLIPTIIGIGLVMSAYPLYQLYESQKKYIARLKKKLNFADVPREEKARLMEKLNHWSIKWIPLWVRRLVTNVEIPHHKLPLVVDDVIDQYYQKKAQKLREKDADVA